MNRFEEQFPNTEPAWLMRNSNDLNKGRPLSDEEQTELYLICGFVRTRLAVRFDKRRQAGTL